MTTTDREVADHHAAGALADELPYWGWLPDDRTCLTRRGELVTLARLSPTVVDGHTPEQLDAVPWKRHYVLLSLTRRRRIGSAAVRGDDSSKPAHKRGGRYYRRGSAAERSDPRARTRRRFRLTPARSSPHPG